MARDVESTQRAARASVQIGTLPLPPDGLCPEHLAFSTHGYCARKLLEGSDRCYFHTPSVTKYDAEVIKKHFVESVTLAETLTREIAAGRSLEKAYLVNARLGGHMFQPGCDLSRGVFVRADFSDAHLSYSVLDNSDFALANLERAYLSDCSLSGVRFWSARLFNAKFRNNKFSNVRGLSKENFRGLRWGWLLTYRMLEEYPQQCEGVYRQLALYFSSQGLLDDASWASYRACIMRHRQLAERLSKAKQFADEMLENMLFPSLPTQMSSLRSAASRVISFWDWARSLMLRMIMGYGEKPIRVLGNAGLVILLYAMVYHLTGAISDTTFTGALYFSAITFTTVGYGDIAPHGPFRLVAASEALTGIFLCGLFLFCLGRRSVGRA